MCAEELPAEGRKVPTREYLFSLRTLLFFHLASFDECLLHACPHASSLPRTKCTFRIISWQRRGHPIAPARLRAPRHSSGWAQPGKKTSEFSAVCSNHCPALCLWWESVPPSQHDKRHPLLGEESFRCVSRDAERGCKRSCRPGEGSGPHLLPGGTDFFILNFNLMILT